MKSKRATKLKRPGQFAVAPGWPSLRWTAEKPKAAGWWWVETPLDRRIVRVWVGANRRLRVSYGLDPEDLETSTYFQRWAGPLIEPPQAPDAEPTPINSSSATATEARANV